MEERITLAISTDRFKEQRVFEAQKQLDKLLKVHSNIGIRLVTTSRTGLENDLIIAQVFTTRDCQTGTDIWTGIENDIGTLLIHIGQSIGTIEKTIDTKRSI